MEVFFLKAISLVILVIISIYKRLKMNILDHVLIGTGSFLLANRNYTSLCTFGFIKQIFWHTITVQQQLYRYGIWGLCWEEARCYLRTDRKDVNKTISSGMSFPCTPWVSNSGTQEYSYHSGGGASLGWRMHSVVRASLASQSWAPVITPTWGWVLLWASASAVHASLIRAKLSLPLNSYSSVQLGKGGIVHRGKERKQCLEEMLDQKSCHLLSSRSMNDKGRLTVRLPDFPHPWVSWHALLEINCASSAEPDLSLCRRRWHQLVSILMMALETQRGPVCWLLKYEFGFLFKW